MSRINTKIEQVIGRWVGAMAPTTPLGYALAWTYVFFIFYNLSYIQITHVMC